MKHPVVHFQIAGLDGKKLIEFYRQLFGWEINDNNPFEYGEVKPEKDGIGGGVMKGPMGAAFLTFFVQTDDVAAHLERAVKLGATIAVPAQEIPGVGTTGYFKDLDGNIVGLFKPS
jgi:predicted enzyme related to lactoylglutathione lyase